MAKQLMGRLEMHQDTRLLIAYLTERFVKEGKDFVSYADLTAAIGGRDVQREARGLLTTARKHLNREHGIILEAVPNEGMRRERDIPVWLGKGRKQMGRAARKRSATALNALADNSLDNAAKKRACMELSLLGAIAMLTQPKALKQIEAKVDTSSPKELPTADTLKAQFDKA